MNLWSQKFKDLGEITSFCQRGGFLKHWGPHHSVEIRMKFKVRNYLQKIINSKNLTCCCAKRWPTELCSSQSDWIRARSWRATEIEFVLSEGDIAVLVSLFDAHGVHLIIKQHTVAVIVVEWHKVSTGLSVILKTTSWSEIICLCTVKLSQKNLPFLGWNGGQCDGECDRINRFYREVDMGASEGSTKVCWESLQGNSVGAGDHQGVIVAASHGRIGNLELFEIKSKLNNLKLIEISW